MERGGNTSLPTGFMNNFLSMPACGADLLARLKTYAYVIFILVIFGILIHVFERGAALQAVAYTLLLFVTGFNLYIQLSQCIPTATSRSNRNNSTNRQQSQ